MRQYKKFNKVESIRKEMDDHYPLMFNEWDGRRIL